MNLKPLLLLSAFAAVGAANAVTIAGWNFDDSSPNATNPNNLGSAPGFSASTGTGVYSTSAKSTPGFGVGSFGGTDFNAVTPGATTNRDLAIQGGSATGQTDNNGTYVQFQTSAAGTTGLVFSYALRGTGTGFNLQTLTYSTNGGTSFSALGSVTTVPSTYVATAIQSFTLPTATNNAASLIVRIALSGATGQGGNNRFDNVRFDGTQAVPEPASMAALGLGALALIRRRRSAK